MRPVQIRARTGQTDLTAYQTIDHAMLSALGGQQLHAAPDDWVILRSGVVLDVMPQTLFEQAYELTPQPGLSLAPDDRATLEKVLGFGTTRDSAALMAAVRKLASLSIGKVEVEFSVAQWDELAHRARKRGQTVLVYMQQLVKKLTQDLWTSA